MPAMNRRGATILELLFSTVLLVAVAVTVSLAFPRVSQNTIQNRSRVIANDLANSAIERIAGQPYSLVDTTLSSGGTNPTCDCSLQPFLPSDGTNVQVTGTTFQVISCVNYLQPAPPNAWTSQCPVTDTGYKNVFVRVAWNVGNKSYFTTQHSFLARS